MREKVIFPDVSRRSASVVCKSVSEQLMNIWYGFGHRTHGGF
jgi:hypothetical protein